MLSSAQWHAHGVSGHRITLQHSGQAGFPAAWPLKPHLAASCHAADTHCHGDYSSPHHAPVQPSPPLAQQQQQQHQEPAAQRLLGWQPSNRPWSDVHAQVLHNIRRRALISDGGRVLLAVSGGQDSMCMARLLLDLQGILSLELSVAHCDHQMRPDSAGNADFVRQWTQSQGLRYYQRTATETLTSEAQARAWRYEQLVDMAQEAGCSSVAIGHTATDRAETLIYNLCRGSGTDGMSAMRWQRYIGTAASGAWLVRPMLNLMRDDTLAVCRATGTQVWEDSTNADTRYSRNSMRLQVLPLLQGLNRNAVQHLAEAAELLSADVDCLRAQASELLRASRAAGVKAAVLSTAPPGQGQSTSTVQLDHSADALTPPREPGHVGVDPARAPLGECTNSSARSKQSESDGMPSLQQSSAARHSSGHSQSGRPPRLPQQQHRRAARIRTPVAPATSDVVPALTRSLLAAAPLALQRRALHQHLQKALGGRAPTYLHVEAVRDLLTADHGSRSNTMPGGVTACVDGLCIRVVRNTAPP